MTPKPARLSKSRFTSGLQCHKKLWWEVHEPDALELQPDKVLQDLFDQGRQVGEAARTRYPGGVLIDLPHHAGAARVAATQKALDAGAPAVFEATFIADDTFVAIDVLEKQRDGYRLTEVKSSTSQKDEHISDVAIQARVAAACGDASLNGDVRDVLVLLRGGRLDLGEAVPVPLFLEHIDRDESIVGDERGLEHRRGARVERSSRRGDARRAGVVRQVDQHAARVARPGRFAHLAALVEEILQDLVGLELERFRLVHLPPELLVALEAGGEARLGEPGGLRRHGAKCSGVGSLAFTSCHAMRRFSVGSAR